MSGLSANVDSDFLDQLRDLGTLRDSAPGLPEAGPCWTFVAGQSTSFGDVVTSDQETLHELVLLPDGRALVKKFYQWETYGDSTEFKGNRKWEIAEGTYTLEDGGKKCKFDWKAHAEADQKGYGSARAPLEIPADAWAAKAPSDGEEAGPAIWMLPQKIVDLKEMCDNYGSRMSSRESPEMVGLTEDILEGLGFCKEHLPFYVYKS